MFLNEFSNSSSTDIALRKRKDDIMSISGTRLTTNEGVSIHKYELRTSLPCHVLIIAYYSIVSFHVSSFHYQQTTCTKLNITVKKAYSRIVLEFVGLFFM